MSLTNFLRVLFAAIANSLQRDTNIAFIGYLWLSYWCEI